MVAENVSFDLNYEFSEIKDFIKEKLITYTGYNWTFADKTHQIKDYFHYCCSKSFSRKCRAKFRIQLNYEQKTASFYSNSIEHNH